MSDESSPSKDKAPFIWGALGLIVGVALSANVPEIPRKFMDLQYEVMGSNAPSYSGYYQNG